MKSELEIELFRQMDTEVKEKLRWFQIIISLYEIAAPHIGSFTGLQCRALEERIIDTDTVNQSARVLRQLLTVIKNMPELSEGEMSCTKRHLETALSCCISISENLIKYIQSNEHDIENQTQLDSLLNALMTTRVCVESIHQRLYLSPK